MAQGVKGTGGIQCTTPGCLNPPAIDRTAPCGHRAKCSPCATAANREYRNKRRVAAGLEPREAPEPLFAIPELPSELPPVDELRERRRREWKRKHTAHAARELIPVDVFVDGPIGLAVFGDLHIDDQGTNFPLIERCTQIVLDTPGMFAASVGDLSNCWIGRLAKLWATQSVTGMEAWSLVEWWVRELGDKLLFLNNGNHDAWAYNANGLDPLEWIKGQQTVIGRNGVRMELRLPCGATFIINCRHDFRGRSELNPAFGVAKSVRHSGQIDDIALAGHLHIAGYNPLKNPITKKVCHPFRVGSFKHHDEYADERDFPDANITECPVFIFDPMRSDQRHIVHVDFNIERGAEVLTMLREKWMKEQRPEKKEKRRGVSR